MPGLGEQPFYKRHHDDEWFDAVQIDVIPRFKTSGLSGDEWRVSTRIRIFRKGVLIHERSFPRFEWAIKYLPWVVDVEARENHALTPEENQMLDTRCGQPGCRDIAVSEYRMKTEWADGHKIPSEERGFQDVRIKFCKKHLRRGDAGLEDADDNYEVISGPGPKEAVGWEDDENPAVFGGFIHAEDLERGGSSSR